MIRKLKDKWLKALRSGDYEQGTGRLRSPDGDQYCCLGVLCDLMKNGEKWETQRTNEGGFDAVLTDQYFFDNDQYNLSEKLRAKAGISKEVYTDKDYDGFGREDTTYLQHLMVLNDDKGWDFNMIADFVEEEL